MQLKRVLSLRRGVAVLALAALACPAPAARGQYVPPAYNPYPAYSYRGVGGTLSGAANLVDARGNFQIQTQQARITSQQANQAQLQTQAQTFDQMQYERANTPTYAEERQLSQSQLVRRMLTTSPVPEITSGTSLNTLIPFVRRLMDQGVAPPFPLDPDMVRRLNVSPVGGGLIDPGLGMLQDWDNAPWPLALFDAKKDLDPQVRQVMYQAKERNLDPKTYKKLQSSVRSYQDNLYKLLEPGKVDTASYFEASTFLNNLEKSVNTLRQPNAYKYFGNAYVAKGNDVRELAYYMTNEGLKFTPATPGNEPAYVSVYNGTVSYIREAEGTSSFMTRIGNPAEFGKFGGKN